MPQSVKRETADDRAVSRRSERHGQANPPRRSTSMIGEIARLPSCSRPSSLGRGSSHPTGGYYSFSA